MKDTTPQPERKNKEAILKASILVAFIIVAIYIIRFTPVTSRYKHYLDD
jgi:hypothetical protein